MVNTETCSWVDKKLMNLLSFSNVKGVSSVIGLPEKTTTFEELIPQLEGFGFPDSQECHFCSGTYKKNLLKVSRS